LVYIDPLNKNYADNNQVGIDENENCYVIGTSPILLSTTRVLTSCALAAAIPQGKSRFPNICSGF
jgi:hypothetical protein